MSPKLSKEFLNPDLTCKLLKISEEADPSAVSDTRCIHLLDAINCRGCHISKNMAGRALTTPPEDPEST